MFEQQDTGAIAASSMGQLVGLIVRLRVQAVKPEF